MIINSLKAKDHTRDLSQVFEVLSKHGMKLNPKKYLFGVKAGKFLDFMVSQRGIEANPKKIQAIMNMAPPKVINEVKKLNERIIVFGRFINCSVKRCMPFFRTLKDLKNFRWTNECRQDFVGLKNLLISLTLFSRPN